MKHKLDQLRDQGYTVRVSHRRPLFREEDHYLTRNEVLARGFDMREVAPKGGMTQVVITAPDGSTGWTAVSRCSARDNFSRKMGLEIALGRAMAAMRKAGVDRATLVDREGS